MTEPAGSVTVSFAIIKTEQFYSTHCEPCWKVGGSVDRMRIDTKLLTVHHKGKTTLNKFSRIVSGLHKAVN